MASVKLTPHERKIIFLSSLGGALEFYDFIIYVIFAQILSQVFFPKSDNLATLMSVYAIFAIGYLVRPLGGLIFSHFGDKYGRKKTFIASVMMMAVPTFLIGLLPTYEQVGIWASFLLITMRIFQGLSVGGEIPGALTFTCEHVDPKQIGIACGIIFASLNFGICLGALVNLILNSILSESQLLTFGWRIPFLFGGVLGIVSFYIRKQMSESPLFIAYKEQQNAQRIPFIEAITNHWRKILQGVGVTILGAVVINLFFLFMPTYLSSILAYPKQQVHLYNTLNLICYSCLIICVCWIGDKIGRTKVLLVGAICLVLSSYFIYSVLAQQNTNSLIFAMFLIAISSSAVMIFSSILVELFPLSIRYTGIAISYNIAYAFFGGLTPLIATYLIKSSGSVLAPSFYLTFCALICVIATFSIRNPALSTSNQKIESVKL